MSKKKSIKIDKNTKKLIEGLIVFIIAMILSYCTQWVINMSKPNYANLVDVPEYSGELCVQINGNKPYFTEEDYTLNAFEK